MTDIPLPATGSTNWTAWAAEQEDLSDQVRNLNILNVRNYNATGDGTTDDTAAIQSAFTASTQIATIPDAYDGTTARPRKQPVIFPAGVYKVTATLTIPQGVDVVIAPGAIIRAGSAMGPIFDTALNVLAQDQILECHGIIDCNNLASSGIYLRSFATFKLITPRVYSPAQHGIILGDPSSTFVPYEAVVSGPWVWRPNGQAVPSGSVGVWAQYATDSYIGGPGSVVVGTQTGCRTDKGNNVFDSVHVWGYPPNSSNGNSTALMMTTGFLDNANGTVYNDCHMDDPVSYGFRFTADDPRAHITAGKIYNWNGADNVAVAVQIDSANKSSVTIAGLTAYGYTGSGSHRLAKDYGGNLTDTVRIGTKPTGVVTPVGDSAPIQQMPPDLYDGFIGADGSAPNTARWATPVIGSGTGTSVQINSNRLRLRTGSTGSYSTNDRVAVASTLTALTDVDLTFQLEYGTQTIEGYFWAGVRGSGADIPFGNSGYVVETSGFGGGTAGYIALSRYVSGTKTALAFIGSLPLLTGTKLWLRLRAVGSTISFKYWPDGQTEPTSWSYSTTDTGVTAGGLVTFSSAGGSAAAVNSAFYVHRAAVRKV